MTTFVIPRDEAELKSFIQSTYSSENRDFDYKEVLPQEATRQLGDKIRNDFRRSFCAFANAKGGYLIVGIKETTLRSGRKKLVIVGCRELSEINRNISHLIKNHINPPIEVNIYSVRLSRGTRYVHFIEIPASPSYRKPHMFDDKIYYRLSGESPAVEKDGNKVREIIEADFFSPGGIHAFNSFIDDFERCQGQLPYAHERYFFNLDNFLNRHEANSTDIAEARVLLLKIDDLRKKLNDRLSAPIRQSEEDPNLIRLELKTLLDQFRAKLGRVLKGIE